MVSQSTLQKYEMVIGLEVHVELKTKTKIFCNCPTDFGAQPNTQCCPICTGMPGTLPVLNRQVVNYAVKAGLATNCKIASSTKQHRKNYFYPDLPKAYQISQYDLPLCEHGYLDIETGKGAKRIGITRIHIEEDAGKLVHLEGKGTLIDCNRGGMPLIEIVSEPDIRSAEEAKAYLQKLRAVIIYTGVSDCKMNEGAFRCDVNLSVREKGEKAFGTRAEMKNINSFQSAVRAIEYEFVRQVEAVEAGEKLVQETRRFDQNTGKTYSMRRKENADDYRYFPDPDLPIIEITDDERDALGAEIPILPDARKVKYIEEYGLTAYAAEQLTIQREIADYFEKAAELTAHPILAANMILSDVSRLLQPDETDIPIQPGHLAAVAQMSGEGRINSGTCRTLIQTLWEKDVDPEIIVVEKGWEQINDDGVLTGFVKEVIAQQQKSVADYKAGKAAAFQSLVGQVMKKTSGRGNPVKIKELMTALLDD
ncbi:MAG: Asp-tRNA(Asn)/Glu-tRNA(Gln) amidotransferase subunit GatB [Oscillospiraceae bacterium]|nr:Asp-tRNA(Asn)/Glu-tRNA(Gln) amidotransferase subunit GatB [Oscillospiraceae bacterium]